MPTAGGVPCSRASNLTRVQPLGHIREREGKLMRFELRDVGGATEFWAFDVHPRFDKAMAGLRWEPVDDAWRRSLACPVQAAEAAFANMTRLLLPVLRQTADMEPIPWQDALAEVCRRFAADVLDWRLGGSAALARRGR